MALDIRTVAYMPFSMASCIILRPPGSPVHYAATRMENIDQFPIGRALDILKERRGGALKFEG